MSFDIRTFDKKGVSELIFVENGGLTTFSLKMIAIITMLIDHIATIFVPGGNLYLIMRAIGRISFPIFSFLIAQGYIHTSNRRRYAFRLGLFAVISEVPYDKAFCYSWFYLGRQNIFFTLFLGLIGIWMIDILNQKRITIPKFINKVVGEANAYLIIKFISLLILCGIAEVINCSYSYMGVFLIICFYIFNTHHLGLVASNVFFNTVLGSVQMYGVFSIVPIALYNNKPGNKKYKWVFYAIYPLHLMIFVVIRHLMNTH